MACPKITFTQEPEFADLWDACLYNLLYNEKEYTKEIESVFREYGITKDSKILDSSAGTGFIALHLRELGYTLECMDPWDDEIRVFQRKAAQMKVSSQIKKISWVDIPATYTDEKFDFIFCRGNSFIYAAGGWNEAQEVDATKSLAEYKKTLQIFYDQLPVGGILYLDKFPDNEQPHKDKVAEIEINGKTEDLVFHTKKIPSKRYREAAMLRVAHGKETGLPNMTFDLQEPEVEEMLTSIGFTFKKVTLTSEKHFVVWIAQK